MTLVPLDRPNWDKNLLQAGVGASARVVAGNASMTKKLKTSNVLAKPDKFLIFCFIFIKLMAHDTAWTGTQIGTRFFQVNFRTSRSGS